MTPLRLTLIALALLALTVALLRSCGIAEPIVIPDWADSLRVVRDSASRERRFWRDSVTRERAVSDSAKRAADSWRQRALVRPARPQPHAVATPDNNPTGLQPRPVPGSGTIVPNPGSPVTHTSADSIVWLTAQIDSLWAALDASDSAYASLDRAFIAQRIATAIAVDSIIRADSVAYNKLYDTAGRAITDLTARLRKAQRGCRVLGLLPCPELALTGGVTTLGGAVGMGATLGVSIPIKLGGS